MAYRPTNTFSVPMILLTPTYITTNGVRKKSYPAVASGTLVYGSFKTYGGTEKTVNGVYAIEDTADVEMWYRPEVASGCRIALANNQNVIFEIVGEPENIEMRNQFLKFKVSRVKGGA